MSPKQQLNFAEAENAEYPPYLLDFGGTPAERHVENLKVCETIYSYYLVDFHSIEDSS
jgi:hypothetical protein